MTKSRFLLFILVLAAAGAAWYYRHLTTTPEYALLQAAKAAQTHDIAAFEKHVDVRSVADNLVDDVAAQADVLNDLFPGNAVRLGPALQLLKPQLAQTTRAQVRRYIETGSVEAAAQAQGPLGVSVLGAGGALFGSGGQFKGVKYTRRQADQAIVGLEFTQPRYDTTLVLEVQMRNQGTYWQATRIANAGALLRSVARLEKQRLLRN
ncbi:hypothetical protein [Hymenobacter weizhouensis]|uniref:hypothetical protein n=1 Tax=Hymenobacter sp. YIM 151500-1 TaxID=2987689 RepID=UPI002226CF31|nr:hypothetical protein [Hymenobacter sp. YIM 151500-1]UYZ62230.1 hypothetical protein OIS53_14650 [Hymenobacter sp. YIM 151500-1]